jgi:hypothetical protein
VDNTVNNNAHDFVCGVANSIELSMSCPISKSIIRSRFEPAVLRSSTTVKRPQTHTPTIYANTQHLVVQAPSSNRTGVGAVVNPPSPHSCCTVRF